MNNFNKEFIGSLVNDFEKEITAGIESINSSVETLKGLGVKELHIKIGEFWYEDGDLQIDCVSTINGLEEEEFEAKFIPKGSLGKDNDIEGFIQDMVYFMGPIIRRLDTIDIEPDRVKAMLGWLSNIEGISIKMSTGYNDELINY